MNGVLPARLREQLAKLCMAESTIATGCTILRAGGSVDQEQSLQALEERQEAWDAIVASAGRMEAALREFLRLTEGRTLAPPGDDHLPGLRAVARAAMEGQ